MLERSLDNLLLPNETNYTNGIHVAKHHADKTVWDDHAIKNPTHAVISAKDEEDARLKSQTQLGDISAHLDSKDILLDLGSGYGRLAQYLLPTKTIAGYVGIDSSCEMLTLFRDRYIRSDDEQRTPLLLINSDISNLPLKNASVDVVTVCAVFLHNHKDVVERSLKEIERVLKPGGTLLIYSSFPRAFTFMGLQGMVYQALLNLLGRPYKNGPVRYYFKKEVLSLFTRFGEVELHPAHFSLFPKTLIFLPQPLETWYRCFVANPINRFLEHLMPLSWHRHFAVHLDVKAKR